jgi:hypothetical protein
MNGPTPQPFTVDARRRSSEFSMTTTQPGDVIEVTTVTGSMWTFVRTSQSRIDGNYMTKMVMMTTSRNAGQITRPWRDIAPEAILEIGQPIYFQNWRASGWQDMHTSAVVSVRLNDRKVL